MKGFQIRNAVLTIVGMVAVNVIGPQVHGWHKPVVDGGLAVLFLVAIFVNAWHYNRAVNREQP